MSRNSILSLLREFKPSLIFLAKFLVLYGVLSFLYAFYLDKYGQEPDPMTRWVTQHTAGVLDIFFENSIAENNPVRPRVFLILNDIKAVSVFEGCNGLNMMILFFSFIIAFSGSWKKMAWFIPVGFLFIHMANIFRIGGLAVVSLEQPRFFYFIHKYLFTAFIFIAIFLLWYIWVVKVNPPGTRNINDSQKES